MENVITGNFQQVQNAMNYRRRRGEKTPLGYTIADEDGNTYRMRESISLYPVKINKKIVGFYKKVIGFELVKKIGNL